MEIHGSYLTNKWKFMVVWQVYMKIHGSFVKVHGI